MATSLSSPAPQEPAVRRAGREDAAASGTTLARLAPGETARVTAVDTSQPIGHRLVALGFVPGTRVRVIRRAPLGDPVTYELRGSRLCLRRSEALRIEVARDVDAPGPDAAPRR